MPRSTRLYQGPILAGSRVVHRKFIRTLFQKGTRPLFEDAEISLHVLFVREKQGRQHLIVDARETNRHFKRPPSVALARPEALAGLERSADSRFWISTVDVRDAFHRMAVSEDLSDCLALPGGTAREFGVYELDGKPLDVVDYLWRCCRCLPMGFRWAVYLTQQAKTAMVVEATSIAESELLHDRQVNLSVWNTGPGLLSVSTTSGPLLWDREEVDQVMGRISHELCSRGLLTLELCLASRCRDFLGIDLDGEKLRTRAASAQHEELRLALHWVLEHRWVSGQKLERVVDLHMYGASASFIRVRGVVQIPAGAL